MKKPRLLYWEPAEDCWAVASAQMIAAFGQVCEIEDLDDGEVFAVQFKRIDMTDEDFDSLEEMAE